MTKTKTKQEYIDTIRKACILADESILDLVEGCKIAFKTLCRDCENYEGNDYNYCNDFECDEQIIIIDHRDSVYIDCYGKITLLGDTKLHYDNYMNTLQLEIDIIEKDIKGMVVKIIGRKIGIAEILGAINNRKKETEIMWYITEFGLFNSNTVEKNTYSIYWKLKENDNIENQDLNTLKYVANLLDNT